MCQPTGVVGALRHHATFSPNEKLSKALPRALFLRLDKDFYPLEMQKTQKKQRVADSMEDLCFFSPFVGILSTRAVGAVKPEAATSFL